MPDCKDYGLRSLEDEDLEKILEWRNSDRIRSTMFVDRIITLVEHTEWFIRTREQYDNYFKLFLYKNEPVGVLNFTKIDQVNNNCLWGFYLGKEGLPRGTGIIMGFLGLEHAFEKLELRKVSGEVFASNTPSLKFHEKLGFIKESLIKEYIQKNGIYQDIVVYGLLQKDWFLKKSGIERTIFSK